MPRWAITTRPRKPIWPDDSPTVVLGCVGRLAVDFGAGGRDDRSDFGLLSLRRSVLG
jgi:hypothetical protein